MLGEARVCVRADNTSDYIQYYNYGAKINKKTAHLLRIKDVSDLD